MFENAMFCLVQNIIALLFEIRCCEIFFPYDGFHCREQEEVAGEKAD
jgi:hypothetical protein